MIILARKTIKGLEEIIEGLEKKLNEYRNMINDRNKQIEHMENVANDSFENSTEYKRMNNEIEYLKIVIKGHEISLKDKDVTIKKQSNTIQKLLNDKEESIRISMDTINNLEEENERLHNNVQKIKNERGAGRKEKFTEEEKSTVKMLRLQGKSYRSIAKDMNCSVATVHKIINKQYVI